MSVDLGVLVPDATNIDFFGYVASKLGLSGFTVVGSHANPFRNLTENMVVYNRVILHGKSINSIRKEVDKIRRKSMIVSVHLKSIEITNWAAEDGRVDLLTADPTQENRLRDTTARLASLSNTSLEIQIAPLLKSTGLNRSKILKSYREAVTTARDAGMDVILTSGASHPLGLRSSVAMVHIGVLLGMNRANADRAASRLPMSIIERNMKKLQPGFVDSGIEVLRKGEEK